MNNALTFPLQVTFRQMDVSPAVEQRIRDEALGLQRFCNRITECKVVIEEPHRHHQNGRLYHIGIDIGVPGKEIIIQHEPSLHNSLAAAETAELEKRLEVQPDHKDIYVAIRDAFSAARRRLEDYMRKRRDAKHHLPATQS